MKRWRGISYWFRCTACGDRTFLKNRTVQLDLGEQQRIPALVERQLVEDARMTRPQEFRLAMYARRHEPCGGEIQLTVARAPVLNEQTRQPAPV